MPGRRPAAAPPARARPAALTALTVLTALGAGVVTAGAAAAPRPAAPAAPQDTAVLVAAVDGLRAPEAVRYDPAADVYYVSNWSEGSASALDNNGFISRVRPDGTVDRMRFIAGGAGGVTLHAPRGMAIAGDTLWAADADAVRGFDRRTGAPVATVSFAAYDPGFLNDVAVGPDGALYVTDTGRNRIYRIAGRAVTVAAADTALGAPNGITWDAAGRRFLVVPFGGAHVIRGWRPAAGAPAARAAAARVALDTVGESGGAQFDGVEVLAGAGGPRVLVASQADSSLHLFTGAAGARLTGRPVVRLAGRPADIAVDTRRGRVAVPYVARNRVEIWQLPRGN
jgi:sugar lactone lactonase YvrE